jgi:hypothetical protein
MLFRRLPKEKSTSIILIPGSEILVEEESSKDPIAA